MKLWKKGFNALLLAVFAVACMQSFAPAKIARSKVIKKDFDAKQEVVVNHQYGPLTIKKSNDGRIHLEAEMLLEGNDEESIDEVLGRFDVDVDESGNRLLVDTRLGMESCNTINGKMTIKYKDGHKAKGLNDMLVKMTLYVADPQSLTLTNKYDRIELTDEYNGALKVELYSGNLSAADLGGSLDLNLKYGKAKVQNIGKAKMVIYDSEVRTGDVQEADISSKYSEFVLGQVAGNLKLETYDENWQVGSVGGMLTLEDKYSEFRFGDIDSASMMMFDAEFAAEQVGGMDIRDSKYSEYKISSVGNLKLGNVFDDNYQVQEANSIEAKDSKYTEYRVGKLTTQFVLAQSFDDAVKLDEVAAAFNEINLDGKYTELTLSIVEGTRFQVSADMKYGNFDYPESKFTVRTHKEKDSNLLLEGFVGAEAPGEQASKLTVKGFDMNVTLR